jgi:hypothetical protein
MENNMDNITSLEERLEAARQRLVSYTSDLNEKQLEMLNFSFELDHGTPYFKIKHFVGDAQITPYAKYRQFLLEIRSREEIIENLLMNIAKQEAQIEVILEELAEATTPARAKLKEFDLVTNRNDLIKIHRRLSSAYAERENFLRAMREMYENGEAILPDGTDLKDVMNNPALTEAHERDLWRNRLGKQAALDILTTGKIGTGNMDAITMLGEEDVVYALTVAMDWSLRVNTALETIQSNAVKELSDGRDFDLKLNNPAVTPKELQ